MGKSYTVQRVTEPTEEQIQTCIDLFADLMKDDKSVVAFTGGELELIPYMIRPMILAGALEGEYYIATDETGALIGYTMWMPPGRDLFGSEAQRNLGLMEFVKRQSEAAKEYWKTTYMTRFPDFLKEHFGPTGKTDIWWLHQAMVRRDRQGQGVARALINRVVEKGLANKETIAVSTTADSNIPVYKALGFDHIATTMVPSPVGDWPIHLFKYRTTDTVGKSQ